MKISHLNIAQLKGFRLLIKALHTIAVLIDGLRIFHGKIEFYAIIHKNWIMRISEFKKKFTFLDFKPKRLGQKVNGV